MFFRTPVNDVTALVLSIGEPTTQDAIDSVRRQTLQVRDIIVVQGLRPFHRAMNEGASRVGTPFFVLVDADMILDPLCVQTLRKAMRQGVGIVAGHLHDEMMRQVIGIKLYRTACFKFAQYRDTIATDTDFIDDIARAGWQTVCIGRRWRASAWRTFGEHKPDYSFAYTYRKYLIEGGRYHQRRNMRGLRWHFDQLQKSRHPSAFVAQIALARGFFRGTTVDALGGAEDNDEFTRLEGFLHFTEVDETGAPSDMSPNSLSGLLSETAHWRDRFFTCFHIGRSLFDAKKPTTFQRAMAMLGAQVDRPTAWIAKMALCQGLLVAPQDEKTIEANWQRLSAFLASADQRHFKALSVRGSGATAQDDSGRDDILSYAADIGLRRFVVAPPAGAEYAMSAGGNSYCRTTGVVYATEIGGRMRINAPLRPFGHIMCAEPERLAGLFWCLDLLKRGYLYAHIPTAFGGRKVLLPSQLARNILERVSWRATSIREIEHPSERFRSLADPSSGA